MSASFVSPMASAARAAMARSRGDFHSAVPFTWRFSKTEPTWRARPDARSRSERSPARLEGKARRPARAAPFTPSRPRSLNARSSPNGGGSVHLWRTNTMVR